MKPLLLNYAIQRKEGDQVSYNYDHTQSLNTVKLANGKRVPLVEAGNSFHLNVTKTKVESEQEDDQFSLLELQTKTEVAQERDDEVKSLLELQTKTFTKTEQDDN